MSKIQSVLLKKSYFNNNVHKATKYLLKEGFKLKKLDITKNFYRYRQLDPNQFKKFRIKKVKPYLHFVIGFN